MTSSPLMYITLQSYFFWHIFGNFIEKALSTKFYKVLDHFSEVTKF